MNFGEDSPYVCLALIVLPWHLLLASVGRLDYGLRCVPL